MSSDDTIPFDVPADEPPAAQQRAPRRAVRIGTIVWGLIVAVVGAGVLTVVAGYRVDVQLAAIVLLIVGGLGIILGPLVQGARRSGHER